jgi:uncharacterized FlaG/YvyC family protein
MDEPPALPPWKQVDHEQQGIIPQDVVEVAVAIAVAGVNNDMEDISEPPPLPPYEGQVEVMEAPALPPWKGVEDADVGFDDADEDGDDDNEEDEGLDREEFDAGENDEIEYDGDYVIVGRDGEEDVIVGKDDEEMKEDEHMEASEDDIADEPEEFGLNGVAPVKQVKTIWIDVHGSLGMKVEEKEGDLIIIEAARGKLAELAGLKEGDKILAASVTIPGNKKASSMEWKTAMPAHLFYSVLLSKERPIELEVEREGAFEDTGVDWRKRKAQDPVIGGTQGGKRRGRKSRKISLDEGAGQDLDQLRKWRDDILRANELRIAADEIETRMLSVSLANGKVDTNSNKLIGNKAAEILKEKVQSLREEIQELWTHPNHTYWEQSFKELIEYKEKTGHCNVTRDSTAKSLVDWVARMRDVHTVLAKSGKTDKARQLRALESEFLNKIG